MPKYVRRLPKAGGGYRYVYKPQKQGGHGTTSGGKTITYPSKIDETAREYDKRGVTDGQGRPAKTRSEAVTMFGDTDKKGSWSKQDHHEAAEVHGKIADQMPEGSARKKYHSHMAQAHSKMTAVHDGGDPRGAGRTFDTSKPGPWEHWDEARKHGAKAHSEHTKEVDAHTEESAQAAGYDDAHHQMMHTTFGIGDAPKKLKKAVDAWEALVKGEPGGGGWHAIPGGKHGGMRKKAAKGRWDYWYPSQGHLKAGKSSGEHAASNVTHHGYRTDGGDKMHVGPEAPDAQAARHADVAGKKNPHQPGTTAHHAHEYDQSHAAAMAAAPGKAQDAHVSAMDRHQAAMRAGAGGKKLPKIRIDDSKLSPAGKKSRDDAEQRAEQRKRMEATEALYANVATGPTAHTVDDLNSYPSGTVLISEPKKGRNSGKPVMARKRGNGNWDYHYPSGKRDQEKVVAGRTRGVNENTAPQGILTRESTWKVHHQPTAKSARDPLDIIKGVAPQEPTMSKSEGGYAVDPLDLAAGRAPQRRAVRVEQPIAKSETDAMGDRIDPLDLVKGPGMAAASTRIQVGAITYHQSAHVEPMNKSHPTGLRPAPRRPDVEAARPDPLEIVRMGDRMVRPDHGMRFTPEADQE